MPMAADITLPANVYVTGHQLGGWHHLFVLGLIAAIVLFIMQFFLASAITGGIALLLLGAMFYFIVADGGWIKFEGGIVVVGGTFCLVNEAVFATLKASGKAGEHGISDKRSQFRMSFGGFVVLATFGGMLWWGSTNIDRANEAIRARNEYINESRKSMLDEFLKSRERMQETMRK